MSTFPPSTLPGTVTQYFPFCTTIMTHILTKSKVNQIVKLSQSCKYFYQKFFAIVDALEIDKNKVKCFKNEQSWNMPVGWILKYGITVTNKLSIISSNTAMVGQFLRKIHFFSIQEILIFETYISLNDINRLTQSGTIKKLKVVLNECMNFPVDPLNFLKRIPNAVEIHIEQSAVVAIINLNDIQQNVKIQKLTIIGCHCSIFQNNFLKNNLASNAEVLFGFIDREVIITKFRNTTIKELLDTLEAEDEKPFIECKTVPII